ncbi:5,6-dimethylbenzimidazole synthase [Streptomyces decoyicus]|uniref:5,6-dimethylbenzimidazole synthase n=1 Tax=Streptomyces decoyicus TaxID=249567 RepID=UPI000B0D6715
MTDTGQVPGEGQPENAGGHPGQPQPAAASSPADAGPTELPGMVSPPGEYPYLDQAEGVVEDDDLLLMPGAQGAWSEQPAPQPLPQPQETHHVPEQQPQQGVPFDAAAQGATGFEPMPAQAGDHESGGRDSGSVDLSAVRIPQPAAPQQQDRARAAAPATPQRRPLHMGPPVPDATGGVVRSLADRGPADAPSQSAGRHAGPPTGGPEYFDAPAPAPETAPGEQPVADAQPGAGLPYTEQTPGDPAAQAFAAPSYAEQPYGGQLSAEQTYGAAGQGPLPGPQLGEIPSQVPSWNEASAQAAHLPQTAPAPAAETVAPEVPAAPAADAAPPVPQDAAQPAEQPQPMPAEDAAAAADGAAVVADAAGAVQDAQAAAPVPPQEVSPAALPDAVVPGQDGTPGAEAAVPDDAAASAPVAAAAAQEVPAADDAAVAAQQPEAVAAEVPQQPVDQDPSAEAEPAEQEPAAEAEAPVPAMADGGDEPVEPVTEQSAAVTPDATAEPAQAPQDEQPAGQEPPAEPADALDQPQSAAPAPVADEPQPQPEAAEPEAAEPVLTEPEAVPAGTGADDVSAAEPAAAPMPVTAPQGPVAQPVSDSGAPLEQTAIEPPEAQEAAAGQPQSDAPADAAGQQTDEVPAQDAAPQGADAAEQQPVAAAPDAPGHLGEPNDPTAEPAPGTGPAVDATPDAPAEAAGAEEPVVTAGTDEPTGADAPAETAGTDEPAEADAPAETAGTDEPAEADAPADLPADAPPVAVHIPAQASGEPSTTDGTTPQAAAAGEEPTTAGPTPGSAPAADMPADESPEEQDIAELVELGEGQDDDQPQPAGQRPAAAPEGSEAPDGSDPAVVPDPAEDPSPAAGYDDSERAAVHRVMRERRDIRNGFRSDAIPNDVLLRVLEAAHTAPSVGHSQPWDFVVIRSDETREKMHQLATAQREAYAKSLPKARAKQFRELKIEAILETPVNIVVTADSTRGGRHTLGRHTQPQMAPYSSALAVENLWLAARAEGLGVGWVSFFDEREMVRELGLPEHLEVVAYLCIGYVDEFPEEPELLQAGWSKRRPLSWVVHEETYGRRALPGESPHDLLQETLQGIRPLDAKALGEAWERQKRMTKPAGALGMLEIISAQLSGLSRKCPPPIPEPAAVAIFAGDHGVGGGGGFQPLPHPGGPGVCGGGGGGGGPPPRHSRSAAAQGPPGHRRLHGGPGDDPGGRAQGHRGRYRHRP